MDTHYSILAQRIPWTQTKVHGVIKNQTHLSVSDFHFHFPAQPGSLSSDLGQPQNSAYSPAQLRKDVNTALPWSTASSLMGLLDTSSQKKSTTTDLLIQSVIKNIPRKSRPDGLVNCLLVFAFVLFFLFFCHFQFK